jgi:DNA-binding NtrC family response regulator
MSRKSVLVVEDEESIRESLVELFESEDVDTVTAATVADAQRCLGGHAIDLVVTDIRLGSKRDGGLQVTAAAGILAADAPVIVLTAFPDESNRLAAGRLGAAHFLQKPVDLDIIARIATAHGIPTSLRIAPPRSEERQIA